MEALTVPDRDGKQPLHWAAHRGHQRMVRQSWDMTSRGDPRVESNKHAISVKYKMFGLVLPAYVGDM